jgi:dTDP-4-dehydrorhamnose 3,5-epimerase
LKIIKVESLKIPEIKIVIFGRFPDNRGYFTELFKKSDFNNNPELAFLKDMEFPQKNESFSKPGTVRGLHFQWNPYMGKFVRTVTGRMVDIVLDIRKGSPNFGKALMYDMPVKNELGYSRWIWVPVGFAHGNYFTEDTIIEYYCTGEYGPGFEAGISPLAKDIDWSFCDPKLLIEFKALTQKGMLITDKDKDGYSLASWQKDTKSEYFNYKR